ncbi:hypothetical protein EVAR_39659_1, partial [Eumeta japonica]
MPGTIQERYPIPIKAYATVSIQEEMPGTSEERQPTLSESYTTEWLIELLPCNILCYWVYGKVTLAVPVEEIAVDNAITSSEAEIVCTESEIISRDPEIISTPLNVEISAEQVIVPVEQEALNQSQLSRTPAPAIPAASRILSTRPNTEDEEDAEPPRTAGRASTHRVDRRRRRRPTPFQMASVQFRNRAERLDLEERRLEVDRLREENIAQNRQLQEKFLQ